MQIIRQTYENTSPIYPIWQFAPIEEILFIDIETTGLSPKTSGLYLIGCAFYQKSVLHTIQWFADTLSEEHAILSDFFDFAKSFTCLLHYNGKQFDLPYLARKAEQFHLRNPLDAFRGIDIYQLLKPVKKLLSLTSLRQKAVEDFLQIVRKDEFDGGQLIPVYQEYASLKDERLLALLLLHNQEDLTGMTKLLSALYYLELVQTPLTFLEAKQNTYTDYMGESQSEVLLSYSFSGDIPRPFSSYKEHLFLACDIKQQMTFRIPLYKGELKLFYVNYKDYYYLPAEDSCIHKSVAMSVDKNYRVNAKKETCYTRHQGIFLPQFSELVTPSFREEYKTKHHFFEYQDVSALPSSIMAEYGKQLLAFFCK